MNTKLDEKKHWMNKKWDEKNMIKKMDEQKIG